MSFYFMKMILIKEKMINLQTENPPPYTVCEASVVNLTARSMA